MRRLTRDPAEPIPLEHSPYEVLVARGARAGMSGNVVMLYDVA